MRRARSWRVLALVWALVAPTAALAGDVYVNGVKVTGHAEIRLEKVDVRIDGRGDVHVDAPGYRVTAGKTAVEQPRPRHYLVTTASDRTLPGYTVDVFLSGRKVARLKSDQPQATQAVGRYLSPGSNEVVLVVHRDGATRRPYPDRFLRVVLGEADVSGSSVLISRALLDWRLTGEAEDGDVHTFRIEVE